MAPPKEDPPEQDDENDDDEDEESPPPAKATAGASKDADDDEPSDEDEEEEDDEEDEDGDEDDEPSKPAAAAPKKAAEPGKPGAKAAPAKSAAAPSTKPKAGATAKSGPPSKRGGAVRARPRVVAAAPARKKGSLVTSMILFVVVVGGLALGFAFLGKETGGGGPAAPKWNVGQDVDLEVTLVASDQKDLGCAHPDEVAGRHCAFESQTKAWSKSTDPDEKKLLRPYTTTNQIQFVGAGLWSEPAMKAKLPPTRFTVKCKYKVEGKMKKPTVRWSSEGPWYERNEDWYSGLLHDCTVVP